MPEQIKAPKRVLWLIERLRNGETLCQSERLLPTGNMELLYFLEPSGYRVTAGAAEGAIASGYLRANGDGLFPSDSQTWSAA